MFEILQNFNSNNTTLCFIYIYILFIDKMDSNLIHMMIENTCLLLTSKSREVVESAISFIKILFSAIDTQDLAQHIEFMVSLVSLYIQFYYTSYLSFVHNRLFHN